MKKKNQKFVANVHPMLCTRCIYVQYTNVVRGAERFFFFFLAHFSTAEVSESWTVLLGSLQAVNEASGPFLSRWLGSGIAKEAAKSKPELLNEGRGRAGASARSWLQRGSFPSTLVRWVQSWSRRLAAKACKAAWVNRAVHRLMRADATECWRRRGACRAFACARSLTKLAASSLRLPPVSMPRTSE